MSSYQMLMAKSNSDEEGRWLPLWMHLKDTAGVMKKLVRRWIPDSVIRASGLNFDEFEKTAIFLAAVHDIGKATSYFQHIISMRSPRRENIVSAGYILNNHYVSSGKTPHSYAGQWILQSDTTDFHVKRSIAVVVGAHHGKPIGSPGLYGEADLLKAYETNIYGEEGKKEIKRIWMDSWSRILQNALDLSGIQSADELPELNPEAQILICGLLIVADWIASNTRYFPLISEEDSGDFCKYPDRVNQGFEKIAFPEGWQSETYHMDEELFEERFEFLPNEVQAAVMDAVQNSRLPGIMILEAQMGAGKTEAALAAAELLASRFGAGGIFFGLPTQATSNGLFGRLYNWAESVSDETRSAIRLAHGAAELNEEYANLMNQGNSYVDNIEDGDESEFGRVSVHAWFQGNKKALLADFVIGTVDQFLMASLRRKHFMLRHLGLSGKVVIIDECHAYDAYMNQYLEQSIKWMAAYGIPVILLSATLPAKRRESLVTGYVKAREKFFCRNRKSVVYAQNKEWKKNVSYPLLTWTDGACICQKRIEQDVQKKEVVLQEISSLDAVAGLLEERLENGGCACIIMNTVKAAQNVYQMLKDRMTDVKILLYHAGFTMPDRADKEKSLLCHMGKKSEQEDRYRFVLIGTQVLEQSLDYDADLMISQICPMDLLLQRMGRLHRHDRFRPLKVKKPEFFILNADSIPQAGKEMLSYDDGTKAVYGEYLLNRTWKILRGRETIQLPDDIPELVQAVYQEMAEDSDIKKDEFEKIQKEKVYRARHYLLKIPSKTMERILENMDESAESAAESRVRDGDSALEVLLLKRNDDGTIGCSGDPDTKFRFQPNTIPESGEGRFIARQRIRLPHIFSQSWMIDRVIRELEDRNRKELGKWQQSPWIKGELVLLLDQDGSGSLCGYQLSYDREMGLIYRKEGEPNAEKGV